MTNGRVLLAAGGAIQAWLARWLRYRFTRGQWIIAVTFGGTWPAERRFDHIIEPPPDRLWADPFVLHENGRTWIFVEEFVYAKARGTIAVIEVRADGTWTQPRRILDRPYHLSYPCVFRWNGGLYMVPESRENRTIDLYRCTEFPDHWELDEVLMRDVDAVDATVFEHDGRWWMYYATDSGDGAGFDRLWLFHAPSPRGPWTQHPHAPLQCDVVGGRPGGRPFVREGRLLRAAQIGTPWYGHAIQLREIVTLTPDAWEERDAGRIDPDWLPGVVGTHTLNDDGGVVVADAQRRRFALLRRAPKIRAPEATYTKVS
jgi:hypothetical protein